MGHVAQVGEDDEAREETRETIYYCCNYAVSATKKDFPVTN